MREVTIGVGLIILAIVLSIASSLVDWFEMEFWLAVKLAAGIFLVLCVGAALMYFDWRPLNVAAVVVSLTWLYCCSLFATEFAATDEWGAPWIDVPWYATWWGKYLPPAVIMVVAAYYSCFPKR